MSEQWSGYEDRPVRRRTSVPITPYWTQPPSPKPKPFADMTPAEIRTALGAELADYIVELRQSAALWRRIANDRLRTPRLQHIECVGFSVDGVELWRSSASDLQQPLDKDGA